MLRVDWRIALIACLPALLTPALYGQVQTRPAAASHSQVALVDIVKVFENHRRFKQEMQKIKADISAFEGQFQQQREAISKKGARLENSNSGPQRRQLERELTRQMADLNLQAQRKRDEILQREAALYYETYQQVQARVAQMSRDCGISLVLRYDSSAMNPQQRDTVLKGVNRAVVFHRNLDLTDLLIRSVSSDVSQNSPPAERPPLVMQRSVSQRLPFSSNLSR